MQWAHGDRFGEEAVTGRRTVDITPPSMRLDVVVQTSGVAPPDDVRAVGLAPLNDLLPSCAAVPHQTGSGTRSAAEAHGVSQLIVTDRLRHLLEEPSFAEPTPNELVPHLEKLTAERR